MAWSEAARLAAAEARRAQSKGAKTVGTMSRNLGGPQNPKLSARQSAMMQTKSGRAQLESTVRRNLTPPGRGAMHYAAARASTAHTASFHGSKKGT